MPQPLHIRLRCLILLGVGKEIRGTVPALIGQHSTVAEAVEIISNIILSVECFADHTVHLPTRSLSDSHRVSVYQR